MRNAASGAAETHIADAYKAEGVLAHAMADQMAAEHLLAEAVYRYTRLGNRLQMARALNNLGVVALDSGDLAAAWDSYSRARAVFEEEAHAPGMAATALNLGVAEFQRERAEPARIWFERALGEFRVLGDQSEEAHAMMRLANVLLYEGDVDGSATWLGAARQLNSELGDTEAVARADWQAAHIALERGDVEAAASFVARTAQAARSLQHQTEWMAGLLESAAQIAQDVSRRDVAVALLAAAARFRRITGTARPAQWKAFYDDLEQSLRQQAGISYAAALARGKAMSMQEALTLVIQSLGRGESGLDPTTQAPNRETVSNVTEGERPRDRAS